MKAILLALAFAGSAHAKPCAWVPGQHPNTQSPERSVRKYTSIPPVYRVILAGDVRNLDYVETALVQGHKLVGEHSKHEYKNFRNMKSGKGLCKGPVILTMKAEGQVGFIYGLGEHWLIVWFTDHNLLQLNAGMAPVSEDRNKPR